MVKRMFGCLFVLAVAAVLALPQPQSRIFAQPDTTWLVGWDANGDGNYPAVEVRLTFRPRVTRL